MSEHFNAIGQRPIHGDEARAAEAYARGWWIRGTLADALAEAARRTPRRVVVIDGAYRLDCQGLYQQATALAQAMMSRMPRGSVVSFMLPNWYEATVIYLAATVAGMVANPILPSLRDRELRFILQDAGSRMIFIPRDFGRHDYVSMLDRVCSQLDSPPQVVVVRGGGASHTPLESLLTPQMASIEVPTLDPDAVRMILYTAGTTGRPKGVLHTHNSIHALICQLREHWLVRPRDRFLVPSPIAHIGGSIYAFECPLLLGTAAVLMQRWDADDAVELLQTERCTHLAGATPFLEQLLGAAQRADTRLPELKLFICGGASVSPVLIRRATAYFGRPIITRVYGSTEVPVTTVGAPLDADHSADTDGRAGFAEITLHGGEIRARGPQMLVGYLHPEDEAEAFDAHGYFRTGDLGHWVDNEYLVVTGRIKDIIVRNGENIAPKEIEDILAGHPGIAQIAIVGLPDTRTGERACAVVVPTDLPGPDAVSLGDYLRAHGIARFKAPEQVVIWNDLPRNDAGKVLKHQIKATLMKAGG
ncbi:AMP-binding protein [Mycobacterium branderi]|uniref:Cyclohexanecarboxylate-CoA ligase n=1 Tax=Mycobacterium branderi TaxID=43348 RepID=A0A7I7WFT5_9MYCO|nr:AMP-binding protein [Mycobacterium branderi]MCV7234650.1 AMP-binding protein [Mycobacterium branderi]ORA33185.1 cyclohexanecarboxylate-CoA ligase [Mycobacterium branderi]BBZ15441.1 cyclohexanecarboxylate-CoA ligase [Mycobacterium branderi]